MDRRLLALKIVLLASFVAIAARLVQIQVLDASVYREMATRQTESRVELPAVRGSIYDRNNRVLVSNSKAVSFVADPTVIGRRAGALATLLATTFGRPREYYAARLREEDRRFVWLERRVRPQFTRIIDPARIEGVRVVQEPQRLYHYDQIAGPVVGATDIDNRGLTGIERQLDDRLRGTNGYAIMQKDARQRLRPSMDHPDVPPVNGHSAVLTIDVDMQTVAEEELRRGIEKTRATGGLMVMMDPATGEVLALAQHPTFNPNRPSAADEAAMRLRPISDQFEPGSVFKIVTATAALENNRVRPGDRFNGEQGSYVAHGGRLITDTHPHGMLTFEQGMAVSSNIVLAKVSDRIGNELLYTTARSFGFGTETGIELPGEIAGELKKPSQWSGVTLNSMAIGYEVGVTPLQIAAAYGAVANGGVLMRPFIVKRVFDEQGALLEETRPQQIRRVLSPATARVLTRFFEGVVNASDGTGKEARVPGLRIAGKTGTSRKFVDGRYEPGKYTASFVGFFPADAPQVVCLVMLDITGGNAYTGGLVSAPIFREVARKVHAMAGRYNGTRAPVPGVRGSLPVPDVATLRVEAARRLLAAQGFAVRVRGTGTVVRAQEPLPGRTLPRGGDVVLSTGGAPAEGVAPGYTVVPDLRGMPMRRAINALVAQHLDAAVSGSGVVAAQAPPGGGQVRTGTRVLVRCEPRKTALFTEN